MAGVKHGDSSEGFNDDEIAAILEVADGMTVWIRGVGDDDKFMGRLVRALMYTGVHITNFCGRKEREGDDGAVEFSTRGIAALSSKSITETTVHGKEIKMLVYRRVKKKKDNVTHVPISVHLMPWLPDFLDQRKPKTRQRYAQLFVKLEDRLFTDKGMRIHLNPHRFRHTAMRLMSHEFGLTEADIEKVTGTTAATVGRYAKRTVAEIAEELAGKGW